MNKGYNKAYYLANRDKIKEKQKEYKLANRDKVNNKKYYE